jgi:hypothetical protein
MTEDRLDDLLSVYLAGREAGAPSAPEELCRDCPELLAELRNRIVAVEKMGRLVAETTGPLELAPADFPSRLGEYAVRAVLGRGGMGAVLLADDTALGRQVAVKVMLPTVAADPIARERFLREARAAAGIQHDHVVQIHHVGEDGGVPYLVMPLLRGEALEARLEREGALPVAEVIRIGAEAAEGLAAAHAQNLIHRDVKPANLWLEAPGGRVKVLDFGLARQETVGDSVTRSGTILGTPAYMAPEQVDGLRVDARADLFSLGASLYRAATGQAAFGGPTLTAVLRAVAERHPPSPHEVNPAIPLALSELIMGMLAKTPGERPPSARAVADALRRLNLAKDLPVDTVTFVATTAVRPVRPVGRSRRRAWLVGGAASITLVGLVVGLWATNRPPAPATQPPAADPQAAGNPGGGKLNPTAPVKYRGSVDLYVYRKDDTNSDKRVPLWDPRAMPLKPGDQLQLIAEVDPPAFLYLFWIDETGAAVPAYPWRLSEWGTRPETEQPVPKVNVKWPDGEPLKIVGDNAGTETVLMLARPTKLEKGDAEVKKWFEGLRAVPFQGDKAKVWFEDYDLVTADPVRAVGKGENHDGPRGLQAELQLRIGLSTGWSRAVSFSRRGAR